MSEKTNQAPVLEVTDLGIDFGGLTAVNDLNLTVWPNEIVGLIGPNGAGKTTVFNMLTKVYQPTRGTIRLNGQDTAKMTTIDVNKAGIARTFQNIRLFMNMSVLDNVLTGMHNEITYGNVSAIFRLPKYYREEKEKSQRAMELLKIFGLDGKADLIAGNLPYETEIAPLLIMAKLEQFDYQAAAAIALVLMAASFLILLVINGYQRLRASRQGA